MRAALLAIVLAACGSTTQAPPPPISNVASRSPVDAAVAAAPAGSAAAIVKMTQFTEEACKCTDRACADLVMEEITKWGQEMAKSYEQDAEKMNPDDMKLMTTIAERLTKCMTAAYSSGPGSGATP